MKSSIDPSQASVWPLQTIASLITEMRGGAPLKPGDFTKSGVKVVPKGGIGRKGWLEVADQDLQYCSEEFANAHRTNQVNDEFTLVVLRDLVPAGPSIGLIVRMRDPDSWVLAQGVYGFKLNGNADPSFLSQLSNTQWYRRIMNQIMVGSTQVHITNTAFKLVVIPTPDIEEQRAISAALSDVDALIAGLDKLIAKKRDLKQAAMQQLLTGQTRLPGFSGEWVEKTLGEIGEISGAGVDKKIRFGEQPVRLLNYMDVYKRTFLKSSDFSHEVSAKPDQIKRCSVKAGDVFFTPTSEVREDIGHSAVALEDMPDVAYSYHVVRLRIFDGWDTRFSAYPFQTKSFLDQASTTCEGSGTRYVITLPKFRALEILYPADKREQAAIASVLFDMDAEIVALETRLAKTRELKQGMMQELLTGRTRLV